MVTEPEIQSLGTDKAGKRWAVLIDLVSFEDMPNEGLPNAVVTFLVFPEQSNPENNVGSISLSIKNKGGPNAKIEDFVILQKYENRGIGSLLLKFICSWARKHNIKRVFGEISLVDSDHFDKLSHLYKKHGYTFQLNSAVNKGDSIFVGKIEKLLA